MTSEDVKSELEKHPFVPIRLHLVSGNSIDILNDSAATMMQNAVMVFQKSPRTGYDIISLRNIEQLEQLSDRE